MARYEDQIPHALFYRRVKTPTVIQMEAVECGAASLSIILSYYGKFLTLEELREATGVSRDGVNALAILRAAEKYGLEGEGHRLDLQELYEMPLPLIAFWNFEHFVVIEGFSKDVVYVNDPAMGPVRITYEELDKAFTGLALVFEKTPEFRKSGKPVSAFEVLWKSLKPYATPLTFSFMVGLFLVIPRLAMPTFTQVFIDNILINHIFTWQGWFLFSMALVFFLTIVLDYIQNTVLSRFFVKYSVSSASRFLWYILRLPMSFYGQRYSGEIASRLDLTDDVAHTAAKQMAGILIDAAVAVIFGVIMIYYDPVITAVGVLLIFCNIFLMRALYRAREDAYAYYRQSVGKSIGYSIGILKSMETIKATGIESKSFSRWSGYYVKTINAIQTISQKDMMTSIIPDLFEMLSNIILLALGAWRIMNGYLTIGMLIALRILMGNFVGPVTRLVNFNQTLQLLKVNLTRLDDVLKNPLDRLVVGKVERKPETEAKLTGSLELNNVTFGFNPLADPLLSHIYLSITPGTNVAIIGPSGCGKSTITKMLGGLYEPWEGQIYYDHVLREDLPRQQITRSLAVIEQDPFVFEGTILENLTVFDPTAEQPDIIKAAQDALLHEEILLRQGGYDARLDSDGANLSGGQRQRLQIARALVRNPSIVILDEATSALDSHSEEKVMQNIRRRGCTCVIVAHRLSTVRQCDEIIVLDKGGIVQKGSHNELSQIPGHYKTLLEMEQTNVEETE